MRAVGSTPSKSSLPQVRQGNRMRSLRRQQDDLFDPEPNCGETVRCEVPVEALDAAPIAIPCGYMTRSNRPCQRLATKPVLIEGYQMTCRGHPMLHCDPACYGAPSSDVGSVEDRAIIEGA